MNKVILMGRLTRDPEVRYSAGENSLAIARFSIAVDRRFRRGQDGAEADFFNCTAFGKQGEFVEKYLKKGTKVLIIAEEIEFAESKNATGGRSEGNSEFQGRPSAPVSEGFMNLPDNGDDEGIPFTF